MSHPVHVQLSIALGIEQVRDPEHLRMVLVLMAGEMLLSFVSNRAVLWKVLFGPFGPERTRSGPKSPSGHKEKTFQMKAGFEAKGKNFSELTPSVSRRDHVATARLRGEQRPGWKHDIGCVASSSVGRPTVATAIAPRRRTATAVAGRTATAAPVIAATTAAPAPAADSSATGAAEHAAT